MRKLVLLFIIFISSLSANASHLIGAEIGYKHVSGNEYEINVNIYGDCDVSGTQNIYNTFFKLTFACKATSLFFPSRAYQQHIS